MLRDDSKEYGNGPLYAHTPNCQGIWHYLSDHLNDVAYLTEEFAGVFGNSDLGYVVGLLHDIGKADPGFQSYLKAQAQGRYSPSVPHAWGGAALAYVGKQSLPWRELCLAIAGHHSGLDEPGMLSNRLVARINQNPDLVRLFQNTLSHVIPETRSGLAVSVESAPNSMKQELNIRMLFSALVDADRLDTERHFEPTKFELRQKWQDDMYLLWERFETNQNELLNTADSTKIVNRVRNEVYESCLQAAEGPKGIYRLTVPTGGGKTRSALAFGIRHALANGLRRIVVAIPYTSIIDQTAKVYREILGEDAVLEHHSQVDYLRDELAGNHMSTFRYELAEENWDAPVIVTTNVQLFESLFSNRPSKCRKIHNLANSVIILDEVQTLPTEILRPTLDVLRALIEDYGVSVVFCTATQPALQTTPFLDELKSVDAREIVPNYPEHFEVLRRVDYEVRSEEESLASIAEEIRSEPQVLVILNTRREALELFSKVNEGEDTFHLSTFLCGAHRRKLIGEISNRIKNVDPVRVISTQVVEAGVDLDFPVVYRALGPLDRIVQAAGRCNREGKIDSGKVVVFRPEGLKSPRGPYAAGIEKTRLLLERYPPEKLHDPAVHEEYFQSLYYDLELDKYNIQDFRQELNYPEVANRYRLIAQDTVPVVVPYEDSFTLLEQWVNYPSREVWRRLQLYVVNLFRHEALGLEREKWLLKVAEELYRWEGGYDSRKGIIEALYDPADLVLGL